MAAPSPDRSKQLILAVLAILGVGVAIWAWSNWLSP